MILILLYVLVYKIFYDFCLFVFHFATHKYDYIYLYDIISVIKIILSFK